MGSGGGGRARDVAGKIALGVLVGGAVARLLGALYRRHHLLTALPGPPARALGARGHEAELKEVGCWWCLGGWAGLVGGGVGVGVYIFMCGWVGPSQRGAPVTQPTPPLMYVKKQAGGLCKYLLQLHATHGPIVRLVLGGEVFVSICDTQVRTRARAWACACVGAAGRLASSNRT